MLELSFSWDDGSPFDKKLVTYFEKYNIPTCLFVPTFNREGRDVLSKNDIKSLSSELVSFGGHTYNHIYLTELSLEKAKEEVYSNKKYLEDILGKKIEHFCFPGGKYTKEMLEIFKNDFDTLRTADTMCSNFDNFLRKPTFHFYPRGLKSLIGNAVRNRDKIIFPIITSIFSKQEYFLILLSSIEKMKNSTKEYKIHIWGHSWELEELNLWNKLDLFLLEISSNYRNSIVRY